MATKVYIRCFRGELGAWMIVSARARIRCWCFTWGALGIYSNRVELVAIQMQGSELEVSYTGNLGRLYLGHETGLKDTNGRKRKEEKGNLYRTSIYISCFVKVGVENSKHVETWRSDRYGHCHGRPYRKHVEYSTQVSIWKHMEFEGYGARKFPTHTLRIVHVCRILDTWTRNWQGRAVNLDKTTKLSK